MLRLSVKFKALSGFKDAYEAGDKALGDKMSKKAKELEKKLGLMDLNIKVITEMEKNVVKVNSFGLMALHMKENF